MSGSGAPLSAESQLQLRLQLMERMAPPRSRVLARRFDPILRDAVIVLQCGPTRHPDWTNIIVLWDRMSIPGVFVGIADRPMDLPLESAGTDQWRRFLADTRVRLLPAWRPEAKGLLECRLPVGIGPFVRLDPCLDH
ncbi:MAG: hypothetical protein O3A31_05405 [Planctomycetota bacterium]|nr:hypothetical protein [Planctomycetota bacterium]